VEDFRHARDVVQGQLPALDSRRTALVRTATRFVGVIFSQTTTVGTWTVWQVVLLTGTSSFIQQIYQAFFLVNCTNLSELVRTGKMDFLLLLPVNTRFFVSLRQVDIPSFANAAFAVCVMTYAAGKLHLHPTAMQFLGFGALCVVGLLVHYSLMFMLASVSFWTVRAQGIVWGYYSLFNIARMPDEAFRGVFKAVFTFALPVLLVSNVPVRVLADKLTSPAAWLVLIGLGVVGRSFPNGSGVSPSAATPARARYSLCGILMVLPPMNSRITASPGDEVAGRKPVSP
jgi:ABC-2 type transport system permease protein